MPFCDVISKHLQSCDRCLDMWFGRPRCPGPLSDRWLFTSSHKIIHFRLRPRDVKVGFLHVCLGSSGHVYFLRLRPILFGHIQTLLTSICPFVSPQRSTIFKVSTVFTWVTQGLIGLGHVMFILVMCSWRELLGGLWPDFRCLFNEVFTSYLPCDNQAAFTHTSGLPFGWSLSPCDRRSPLTIGPHSAPVEDLLVEMRRARHFDQ